MSSTSGSAGVNSRTNPSVYMRVFHHGIDRHSSTSKYRWRRAK